MLLSLSPLLSSPPSSSVSSLLPCGLGQFQFRWQPPAGNGAASKLVMDLSWLFGERPTVHKTPPRRVTKPMNATNVYDVLEIIYEGDTWCRRRRIVLSRRSSGEIDKSVLQTTRAPRQLLEANKMAALLVLYAVC